jgi:hypothetical protein
MTHVYDNVDLEWSWNGDLALNKGDLADTSKDYLLSINQDVHMVAASSLGDWELYQGIGATLDEFMGEPNIKPTADAIHDRLKMSLVTLGVVAEEDLDVRIIPVHTNKVLIIVRISATPTPWNSLSSGEVNTVYLSFDFLEHGIVFFEKPPEL